MAKRRDLASAFQLYTLNKAGLLEHRTTPGTPITLEQAWDTVATLKAARNPQDGTSGVTSADGVARA